MGPWAALGLQRDFGVQPGGQMLRFGSPLGFWSSWEILGGPGVSISTSGLITGGFGCGAESLVASKPLIVAHAAGPGVLGGLGPQAACPGGSRSDPLILPSSSSCWVLFWHRAAAWVSGIPLSFRVHPRSPLPPRSFPRVPPSPSPNLGARRRREAPLHALPPLPL